MDLLGDIVEHDLSGAEALPPKPKQQENERRKASNNGFPTARKQRPSRWRQRLEKKGITSISGVVKADRIDQKFSVNEEKIDGTDGLANEKSQREQISQQNLDYVKHMNVSEKEEMRKELLENVNSKTLSLLIKRSRQGKKEENDEKKEENNEEKEKKEDYEKGKKENNDDKNKNSKSEESGDMGTKLVPDVVPIIDADNTWIGGYKNTETATEAKDSGVYIDTKKEDKAAKCKQNDGKKSGEVENGSSGSSLKPVLKKYGKSKQKAKKVRFNNEAKVQYPDAKGKESDNHNSDDEWEDIEFLDDAGPTYEEARKLLGESAKKTIDHAKFHKREDEYEKIDLADPAFNEKLHEKYFPDLPNNPNQLEWMSNKNVPKTPKVVSYDSIDDLRFDFKGDIITSENIAQHSETTKDGLHNHSAHPELPGYTIPELAQYLQSTYPGQRCIASRTLGRIMFKLGSLNYSITEVTNEKAGGVEKEKRKASGEQGLFEQKCWELILKLHILEMLNNSAAETEKNISVRNYAIEALWLWSQADGDDICKKVAAQVERERQIYQV